MIINNSNLNLSNKTNKANDIDYNYNINFICNFKINKINENEVIVYIIIKVVFSELIKEIVYVIMKIGLMSVLMRLYTQYPRIVRVKPNTPVKLYEKIKIFQYIKRILLLKII